MNIYNNDDWIMRPEAVASGIIGEDVKLDNDICIYFKLAAYKQGVFDRIAKTPNYTLLDEIKTDSGFIMLGNPEKIRSAMHQWVDGIINELTKLPETNNEGK